MQTFAALPRIQTQLFIRTKIELPLFVNLHL
ncbi:hypothetical protein NC652_034646 [Populus alba x Populus x berolinensis]|nr:hypothetical protein NC652_034646 [Populus alba x Populus x berolinensis]